MAIYKVFEGETTEQAQARAAAFEATTRGAAFAKKLQTATAGHDRLGAAELAYTRDRYLIDMDLLDILCGLYSIGYERGQRDAKRKG